MSRSTWVAYQLIVAAALNIFTEVATVVALIGVLTWTAPTTALGAAGIVLAVVTVPIIAARRAWVRAESGSKRSRSSSSTSCTRVWAR